MFESVLLDSGASHNFIAAAQVTEFCNSIYNFLLCFAEPMEVHLADNSLGISHQVMHLPLQFADSAMYTVEF